MDYTQDFSGTLDRERLVHLLLEMGYEMQGYGGERGGTILDNTASVGEHVCTWVADGKRTKIYNKIVSNFEAGEVQKPMGGKLAEYVDCPNAHLRRTFQHPDVQRRGCTRIEISVYGRDFSTRHTNTIEETLECLGEIFVVQPPRNLWKNLSQHLDRCLVVSCKENKEIFLAWYCHTQTGRIAGVRVHGNPDKWEESIVWTIAEFGFRRCPIFRIDVASLDPIEILPLRCYTKDSPTILAESTMPTRLHKDAPRIEFYLPSTEYVEWQWRTKKAQTIGVEKSPFEVFEVPSSRKISFLSKKKRQKRMEEIADALEGDKWVEATNVFREELEEKRKAAEQKAQEDRKRIAAAMEKHKKLAARMERRVAWAENVLDSATPQKISLLCPEKYRVVAYAAPRDIHPTWRSRGHRVLLRVVGGKQSALLWATDELLLVVENGRFEAHGRRHIAIPGEELVVEICGCRVEKVYTPTPSGALEEYKELRCELYRTPSPKPPVGLGKVEAPAGKERVQTLQMQEGEYQCWCYAESTYRGKPVFLETKCEACAAGECLETHPRTPVWGHFLEEELQKIDLHTRRLPLYCSIGRERTMRANKKDRIVYLA